ncbi:MAG: tol-pal system protein YbgF [Desulfovibrio sp.]|nr:tol-pal system protein YbgF [Desulfovibrio sp.]
MTLKAKGCAVCLLTLLLTGGCASTSQRTEDVTQRQLRETESRLKILEGQVASLNGQVAQLDTREYEVRNRSGRKTGMTAVPVRPLATAGAVAPTDRGSTQAKPQHSLAAASSQAPKGRKIDPATSSSPLSKTTAAHKRPDTASPRPGTATHSAQAKQAVQEAQGNSGPSGQIGRPESAAGPSGQLAAQKTPQNVPVLPEGLALPPVEAPGLVPAPAPIPAPVGAPVGPTGSDVPVPDIKSLGLTLPPEDALSAGTPSKQGPQEDLPPAQPAAPTPEQAVTVNPAPAVAQTKPPTPGSTKDEEAAYKRALNLVLAGRSNEGMSSFRDFLQTYPQGRYAPNAHYWLGESLYAQGKFSEAFAQFQSVSTSFPKHHKSADALLKAGMSLGRMGDRQGAAAQYKLLLERFPKSEAARLARTRGLAR